MFGVRLGISVSILPPLHRPAYAKHSHNPGMLFASHHLGHPRMLPSRTYPSPARHDGFQAWSVARNIANQWDSIVHGADAVILDWQLARHLAPLAVDSNVPWYLMDRSPPADASLLTYPQKKVWKRAWKYATSTASGGFSVSEAHSAYIARMVGSELPIKSIPAGVDGFSHTRDPDLGPDPIRLIYHGRLDKNRAVLDLPEVLAILDSKGFTAEMTLLGQGNAVRQLERSCASAPNLRASSSSPR